MLDVAQERERRFLSFLLLFLFLPFLTRALKRSVSDQRRPFHVVTRDAENRK